MYWALKNGERVSATPGDRATCPCCQDEVIAKCGSIVIHHWAHRTKDCDPWYEPESAWHLDWKSKFPKECQEVTIGNHRADIKTRRFVVELQSSPISADVVRDREQHYNKMLWIVNAEPFVDNLFIRKGRQRGAPFDMAVLKPEYYTFHWKWPRRSWMAAQQPILFDLGYGELFCVHKIYDDIPCGGWGKFIDETDLLFHLMR